MSDKLEVGKVYDLPETVSMTVTRSWYANDYGDVEVVGPGPLSDRFREIHQDGRAPYLVFADTMRYRMDGERHPLDVTSNWEAVEMDIKTDSENVNSFPVFPRSTFLPWTTEGATLTSYLCPVLSDEEFEAQKEQSAKQARLDFFRAGIAAAPVLDPVREVEAVMEAIHKGEITHTQAAAEFGLDIDEVIAEKTRDRARWAEIASLCQPNGGDA